MGDRAEGLMNRRQFLTAGAAVTGGALLVGRAGAGTLLKPSGPQGLIAHANAALDRHAGLIPNRDVVGIADFGLHNSKPRFHLLDLHNGRMESFLVAHGRGSDPAHTGWLKRFSNVPGSEASSEGTYVTKDIYSGAHGRSRRLAGLDRENDQAEPRGIVMHGAWYVNRELAAKGAIGRSEGCFAFEQDQVGQIIDRLGTGRMILALKA
jgi:hypothetical protein